MFDWQTTLASFSANESLLYEEMKRKLFGKAIIVKTCWKSQHPANYDAGIRGLLFKGCNSSEENPGKIKFRRTPIMTKMAIEISFLH